MVSGRKSIPGFSFRSAVAVTRTTVSPYRTVTAPSACFAILPVSTVRVRPPNSMLRVIISRILLQRAAVGAQAVSERVGKAKPLVDGRDSLDPGGGLSADRSTGRLRDEYEWWSDDS